MNTQQEKSLKAKNAELENELAKKNRELEIEAALEKVRSRSLAMHKSQELHDVVTVVSQELQELGVMVEGAVICVHDEATKGLSFWSAISAHMYAPPIAVPYTNHPVISSFWEAKERGVDFYAKSWPFEIKNDFWKWAFENSDFKNIPEARKNWLLQQPGYSWNVAFAKNSSILIPFQSRQLLSDTESMILKRFAKVFDQAYVRFLDLQKAEVLAREAQIQLALERVRARTMAMLQSAELAENALLLFQQLQELGLSFYRTGFYIWQKDSDLVEGWSSNGAMDVLLPSLLLPFKEDDGHRGIYEAALRGETTYEQVLAGEELAKHHQWLMSQPTAPATIKKGKKSKFDLQHIQYKYAAIFKQGYLLVIATEPQPIAGELLKRFAKVFEQTYTRFFDLQKAEKQAREARIEAALERVRSRAMAMHKTDELLDAAELLYEELTALGISSMAVTYSIMDAEKKNAFYYSINPVDGKMNPMPFDLPHTENEVMRTILSSWKKHETYQVIELDEEGTRQHQTYIGEIIQAFFTKNKIDIDFSVEAFLAVSPKKAVIYTFNFAQGYICIIGGNRLTNEQEEMVLRFTKVFELTYRRFLDIKQAEGQAKEAKIQLALERIRAKTMAMQHSDELREVVVAVYEQLQQLSIDSNACNIITLDRASGNRQYWVSGFSQEIYPLSYQVPNLDHPYNEALLRPWLNGDKYTVIEYKGEMKKSFDDLFFAQTDFRNVPDGPKKMMVGFESVTLSTAFVGDVSLQALGTEPLSAENASILQRFTVVFEQTYTRFLDLQKAEAQVRESQIQLALERVRARTMAMQRSEELSETAAVLFQQFKELGSELIQVTIGVFNEEERVLELRVTNPGGGGAPVEDRLKASFDDPYLISTVYHAWKAKKKSVVIDLKGKKLQSWINYRNSLGGVIDTNHTEGRRVVSFAFFSKGSISLSSPEPLPDQTIRLMERFAAVFDGTYTRFLDLKQAEAQAREAQIQLGLERVRARAMAMQTSEELNALVGTVFEELTKLDFVLTRCLIMIFDPETLASRWWMANSETPAEPMSFLVQNNDNPACVAYLNAWRELVSVWRYDLKGKVKRDWDDFLFVDTELARLPVAVIDGMKAPETVLLLASFNNFGCLTLVSLEPLSAEHSDIMLRFAKVFDMSYTRFNDLKQAEAQAREAKIEASLERVRSKTMAMHNSADVGDTVATMFDELVKLGIETLRCGILIGDNTKEMEVWTANSNPDGIATLIIGRLDMMAHPLLQGTNSAWKNKDATFEYRMIGNDLKDYYRTINNANYYPVQFDIDSLPSAQVCTDFFFRDGALFAFTAEPLAESAIQILTRFAGLFGQTYRRYLDLQKAEAQAREGKIEASLERVRAKTMAMHNSEDVADTVVTMFDELVKLGVETTVRCGVGIMDRSKHMEVWAAASKQEGKVSMDIGRLDMTTHPLLQHVYSAWENEETSAIYELIGEEVKNYLKIIHEAPDYPFHYMDPLPVKWRNSAFFFPDGCLFAFTNEPLPVEVAQLFQRFAGVFGLTYRRYLDLQKAEKQAREAQIQLALERIRSRSMAMQKSDELAELIQLTFDQLLFLGFRIDAAAFDTDFGERFVTNWWLATPAHKYPSKISLPVIDHPVFKGVFNAYDQGMDFFSDRLTIGEKNSFFIHFYKYNPGVPEERKQQVLAAPGYARSIAIAKNISLTITNYYDIPYTDQENAILRRLSMAFDQTYTRFLDLQKAEAQAHEARIEAALERVRGRAMAMHSSEDLSQTVNIFFKELKALGITPIRCGVGQVDEATQTTSLITTTSQNQGESFEVTGKLKQTGHPVLEGIFTHWQSQQEYHPVLRGADLIAYCEATKSQVAFPVYSRDVTQYGNFFYFKEGLVNAWTEKELLEEDMKIFRRFTSVLSLTYRRYIDLKEAEAQAREAQIENALEKVRSRTMAMQHSEELAEASVVLFQQMISLGIKPNRLFIGIIKDESGDIELWATEEDGSKLSTRFTGNIHHNGSMHKMYEGWKHRKKSLTIDMTGKVLKDYFNYLQKELEVPFKLGLSQKRRITHIAYFSQGFIAMATPDEQPAETTSLMERFAAVFNLTYTRFNDLQKAEAQAHEARVEAALERVRGKAMAMHRSSDLNTAVLTVFEELEKLDLDIIRCGIGVINKENRTGDVWTTVKLGEELLIQVSGKEPMYIHPLLQGTFDAWLAHRDFSYVLEGEDMAAYYKAVATTNFNLPESHSILMETEGLKQYYYTPTFQTGNLYAFKNVPFDEDGKKIMQRFAAVLNLTFNRFFDLQKAEAQTHEAQIEAALERVRGRAMAMHNSSDLSSAASVVFTELRRLGISPIRCGVGVWTKDSRRAQLYSATTSDNSDTLSLIGWVELTGHPVLEKIYDSSLTHENYFPVLDGKELKTYYKALLSGLQVPSVPDWKSGEKQYGHFLQFPEGCLYAWGDKPFTGDEIKILDRFKAIISLTFRRYFELQKSEANARDAIREASLDRVRAEIASMRTTQDLEKITPLVWNELTILGIPFIRCGVFIINEQDRLIHTYLSTPDGKALAAFDLQFDSEGIGQNVLPAWRKNQLATIHWNEEEFANYTKNLVEQGTVKSQERYVTEHPDVSLDLHFLPFLQGMLYVGNTTPLKDDELSLVQSLADAFSTAYARYEDFNKLEAAKQQVENTLTELKSAQTQLVQKEKMASLGELTAGIAHEIQNPLNFVNNFSEVNRELLEELKAESKKPKAQRDEQLETELINDLIGNEEKINHHGKRADSIVKGMLEHSRSSTGEKVATNINLLADEFLKLSYHGLRAKDKNFNAEMITHFDAELPKVNIIQQDIGRVLLNLFNNAFYAVNQKLKTAASGYKPEVTITTLSQNGQLALKVKDNGNGIPDAIKDKIMQPFFTTKPTGEGTGLGLSLSYDIVVKGHGGSISVNTKEYEFTEFTITLPIN